MFAWILSYASQSQCPDPKACWQPPHACPSIQARCGEPMERSQRGFTGQTKQPKSPQGRRFAWVLSYASQSQCPDPKARWQPPHACPSI